jgi:tubulin polyglutamylase TTLL6/13
MPIGATDHELRDPSEFSPLLIESFPLTMACVRPLPRKPLGVTVNLEHTVYPAVGRAMQSLAYPIVTDHRITVLFWQDGQVTIDACLRLKPWQFVNHFPGTFAIANKVALARYLERLQKRFPALYAFHPKSYALPGQLSQLQLLLGRSSNLITYIVKPDLGSQGRGIFLVQEPEQLENFREAAIAQEYVAPFLINGLKFDFRIYVLIASVDPLRIYIFEEGMARFCTESYRPPQLCNLHEVFRHLTNYSVNKHNRRFQQNETASGSDEASHKRSMSSVFAEIRRSGGDADGLRSDIERIVTLTILSAHAFLRHNYRASFRAPDGRSRCFEILGFDILIDQDLKPWVLEVNQSPSFHCDSGFDLELKENVIGQALRIMDIPFDFFEAIQQRRKERAFEGLIPPTRQVLEYSFTRERQVARSTQWKLLYPRLDDDDLKSTFEEVFQAVEEMAMLGLDATRPTGRKRGAPAEDPPVAHKPPRTIFVPRVPRPTTVMDSARPTRSVLLLQRARRATLLEQTAKESSFMFSAEYESFVDKERQSIRSHLVSPSPLAVAPLSLISHTQ